jgi:hypothetical protein
MAVTQRNRIRTPAGRDYGQDVLPRGIGKLRDIGCTDDAQSRVCSSAECREVRAVAHSYCWSVDTTLNQMAISTWLRAHGPGDFKANLVEGYYHRPVVITERLFLISGGCRLVFESRVMYYYPLVCRPVAAPADKADNATPCMAGKWTRHAISCPGPFL